MVWIKECTCWYPDHYFWGDCFGEQPTLKFHLRLQLKTPFSWPCFALPDSWKHRHHETGIIVNPPVSVHLRLAPQVTLRRRSGHSGVCVLSHVGKAGKWGRGHVFPLPTGHFAAEPCGKLACATTPLPVRGSRGAQVQVRLPQSDMAASQHSLNLV